MGKISRLQLYLLFVKIGAILLGGGYVILPILMNEFVEKRNLLNKDELIDYFALSQSLPGIIAANISMFTGYKLYGKFGAIIAMFGIVTAPFFCIVLLASLLSRLTDNIVLQNIFWGVGIGVIALIVLTIREIWQNSKRDLFFHIIFLISLFLLLVVKLSPIQVILASVLVGILYEKFLLRKEVE